jgi:TolB-like protein/Flp pilus assembly protein TadD
MGERGFFFELKRRNVIRFAGLYLVAAWLIVQVASTVLPMFGAPEWLPRSIVVLLAVAFVPALVFSWAFELTPQGLKRDEEVPPEQSIAPQTARRMDRTIIAVLVLALGYFVFDKFVLTPGRVAQPNDTVSAASAKSIAVLPFENLSEDKANAYFAEGVQDEILTRLVGAWLLTQVASTVLPTFEVPTWALRGLIITLALGFIPALIFSWVFELTPQGLKRDDDVAPEQSIAPQTARRMDRMIIVVLLFALGYFCVDKFVLAPKREAARSHAAPNEIKSATIPEKSIAVLPFENLSDEKSNAYFADGIQDEILTRLAKIAALKVISRTSTHKYKSAPDNLREVGKQLGVANLVEGSVQKVANAVHVNVQLIRATTDEHLWAESYNRKVDDVFGVEGEIATAIADQLNAKLTQSEQKAVTAKPTQNTAAYDAYLRGVAFQGRVDDLRTNWVKSAEAFAEAVRLDPDFAVGWAQLSRQESLVYNSVNHSPDHRAAARNALDHAMKLGPDLVETKIAQGWYQSYVEGDYDAARASLEQVRRRYPNDSTVSEVLAAVLRRQGHWEESRRLFDQTVELDPRNVFLLANAALAGLETRDPAYTQQYMRRALDLSPQNATLVSQLAASYQISGDIKQTQAVLDSVQPQDGDSFYFGILASNAILLRNYQPAIATLQSHLKNRQASDSYFPSYENYLADLQRHAGDIPTATNLYKKTKADAEELLRSQPNNADLLGALAWSETWLGDKSAALKHAQRAVTLMPAAKEPRVGPSYEDTLARIQAQLGEKDAAIAALQHLLVTSYSSPVVTPALLRLDPDWDNLRGDPRFQKLCQEKQP